MTWIGVESIWRGFPDDAFEVQSLALDGRTQQIVRRPCPRVPSPDGLRDIGLRVELESYGGGSEQVRTAIRARWESMDVASHLPPYADIVVGSDTTLWVRQLAPPSAVPSDAQPFLSAYGSGAWSVFDSAGRWLGTLEMPSGFDMKRAGRDWLLGQRTDELGVTYVARYGLIKN